MSCCHASSDAVSLPAQAIDDESSIWLVDGCVDVVEEGDRRSFAGLRSTAHRLGTLIT